MNKKLLVIIIALVVVFLYVKMTPNTPAVVTSGAPAVQDDLHPVELGERMPSKYACVGEYCDGSMMDDNSASRTVLQIPLVTDGGNVGCGAKIFFAPHWVSKTTGVLDATYRLLFDLKSVPEIEADGFRNVVGMYTRLHYDSVSIANGTAKLMLKGIMYGPGHCAEPELRAQIDQAAFQFPTVNKLEVYLNGQLFDWCTTSDADPSEDHCDTTPKYWIDTK
ncbi:MAG: hypothetical protein KBB91_01145 [Candidatus Pacebacteria bacterium]|nr:hypothetical protein [Candidatus Paceibacterota bacterium]MBP9700963.1 hypothetical protein [Candidatus Paceibacterota bacterium]